MGWAFDSVKGYLLFFAKAIVDQPPQVVTFLTLLMLCGQKQKKMKQILVETLSTKMDDA